MTKVRILVPRNQRQHLIEELHRLKLAHIVEKSIDCLEIGKPEVVAELLSAANVKLQSVMAQLSIKPIKRTSATQEVAVKKAVKEAVKEAIKAADHLASELNQLHKNYL